MGVGSSPKSFSTFAAGLQVRKTRAHQCAGKLLQQLGTSYVVVLTFASPGDACDLLRARYSSMVNKRNVRIAA